MLGIPEYVMQILVLTAGLSTIASMQLVKHKNYYGWYISLGNQALWLVINVDNALWGFLILNAYLVWNAIHAIMLWRRHDRLVERAKNRDPEAFAALWASKRPGEVPAFVKWADDKEDED